MESCTTFGLVLYAIGGCIVAYLLGVASVFIGIGIGKALIDLMDRDI